MTDFWKKASDALKDNLQRLRLPKRLPIPQRLSTWASRQTSQWLDVDDEQIATILDSLRRQLPTTEAILVGKPQAGKSSIVRGLTGVSADIVGQGFRPHTQHTQQYAYPSDELPLLMFTDTVGLGDIAQNTEALVAELVSGWSQESQLQPNPIESERSGEQKDIDSASLDFSNLDSSNKEDPEDAEAIQSGRARVLILTVKINDFAIASLKKIIEQMRSRYPSIPCLLVVTCTHEVYPPTVENHPDYPPDGISGVSEVSRAFEALKEAFAGLWDRAVLIDFTLEGDDYDPVFYGLDALRDTLADLLPEAEARTIHQLLDADTSKQATEQLGNVYREVGRRYMLAFATIAATLAAVPLPFATMPVLTALQVSMVGLIGKLYGQTVSPSQAGGIVSAIAGGFLAQAIGRELIKFIPGFGSVVAASWAAAYTWALGEGVCVYFGDLMGGKKPDPERIQQAMQEAFQTAKERFKNV